MKYNKLKIINGTKIKCSIIAGIKPNVFCLKVIEKTILE